MKERKKTAKTETITVSVDKLLRLTQHTVHMDPNVPPCEFFNTLYWTNY